MTPRGMAPPPSPFTPHPEQLVALRTATETMAAVLFICVLGQPLVLAHLDGFTAVGLHASGPTRSAMLGQIKVLCAVLVTAAHMIFMIGQYLAGAKLFAAPVDFAPAHRTRSAAPAPSAWRGSPEAPPSRGAPSRRSRGPLSPTPPLAPSPPRKCSVARPPRYQTPLPTASSSTSEPPPRKA
jgi:hypothetical protein